MQVWKQTVRYISIITSIVVLFAVGGISQTASADHAASTNYQVNETFFGSGGELNACSTSYCSKQSAGEITTGNTASTNYQAQGGFNTDRTPYIEFSTNPTNIDLGSLSPTSTKTANATFSVKAYLSNGYQVVTASPPPSTPTHTMTALSSPTAATAGNEEFGINLVANTVPTTFGANPAYTPSATFSYGQVAAAYSSPNLYMYNSGDVVALSTQSTSDTTFTISYIFNISNVTPAGDYYMNHVLVATATY